MRRPTVYFSGDLEASGPVAPIYTMLSVGFCTLEEDNPATFYVELKPISLKYDIEAMRVGCRGLTCVKEREGDPVFDPLGDRFDPCAVLAELTRTGESPEDAMPRLARWVHDIAEARGGDPRGLYAPASFESSFLPFYFHQFAGEHPFGHSARDPNSYLAGALGDEHASIKRFYPEGIELTHHALEDALRQAQGYREAQRLAAENRIWRGLRHPTR